MRPMVDLSALDPVTIEGPKLPIGPDSQWPCSGCGERRRLEEGHEVTLRPAEGGPGDQQLLLCRTCVSKLELGGRLTARP